MNRLTNSIKLAKRINVIGTSGSGKSTFARTLATRLQYPYIEMDALYWLPNWTGKPDEKFESSLQQAIAPTTWVLDGNYSRTQPIKWAAADTVIWLDMSRWLTHYRVTKRSITRALSGQELWSGNTESMTRSFLSRESVILWSITSYKRTKQRYDQLTQTPPPQYEHLNFIRLRSPKQAATFLANVSSP